MLSEFDINKISQKVIKSLSKERFPKSNSGVFNPIPVGVSNRHLHLCQEDLFRLFGINYKLNVLKELSQPGQFAAKETVTLIGTKGIIQNVRILGPVRKKTQIEISLSDSYKLGVKPPILASGNLTGSPGIAIKGTAGLTLVNEGVICSLRHIHMTPQDAQKYNVKDKQMVKVQGGEIRKVTFENVLVRVNKDYKLDFHIDIDEANAAGLSTGDLVYMVV